MTEYFRGNFNVENGKVRKIPSFILTSSAVTLVAHITPVNFPFNVISLNNYFTMVSPVSTVTIPSGYGGTWRFTFSATFQANNNGERLISILRNGAEIGSIVGVQNSARMSVTRDYTVAAGDTLNGRVYQTSGVNLTVGGDAMTNFSGFRLSD